MAQLIVRNLEDRIKKHLQRRARRNGRSMEEEARVILRTALSEEKSAREIGLGTEIANIFAKHGLETPFPKLRIEIKPPSFEE